MVARTQWPSESVGPLLLLLLVVAPWLEVALPLVHASLVAHRQETCQQRPWLMLQAWLAAVVSWEQTTRVRCPRRKTGWQRALGVR